MEGNNLELLPFILYIKPNTELNVNTFSLSGIHICFLSFPCKILSENEIL